MLTQNELKEVLSYDPDTGLFKWRLTLSNSRTAGKIAGVIDKGYIIIKINKVKYGAHRLAFLYMKGAIPFEVDHINMVRHDNRWLNLRPATRSQNMCNRKSFRNNMSGQKGVYWVEREQRWVAYIQKDKKRYCLGYFKDLSEAKTAYDSAALKYHDSYARV